MRGPRSPRRGSEDAVGLGERVARQGYGSGANMPACRKTPHRGPGEERDTTGRGESASARPFHRPSPRGVRRRAGVRQCVKGPDSDLYVILRVFTVKVFEPEPVVPEAVPFSRWIMPWRLLSSQSLVSMSRSERPSRV